MKKKLLATILAVSLVATGAVTTAVCIGGKDNQPTNTAQTGSNVGQVTDDKGTVMGEGINAMPTRMTFRNARAITNASEYDSVTIQATVKPDNATNKSVSWSVAFVNPASAWATGKNVTDYVTVTPQSVGSNIATVECLQPFGEQIKITVTSESNVNAKAECAVDFAKRVQRVPFDIQCFEENFSLMNQDFSMDSLYLNVGLSWDLWIDEPNCEYTDYTVDDEYDSTLEIYVNEDVLEQFNKETGFFVEPATLEMDESEGAIYGPLLYTLDGVNWNDPEFNNKLTNWFMANTDKAMFTLRYKKVGKYSTWEAEVPIYVNVDQLSVLVTEITLSQSNMII